MIDGRLGPSRTGGGSSGKVKTRGVGVRDRRRSNLESMPASYPGSESSSSSSGMYSGATSPLMPSPLMFTNSASSLCTFSSALLARSLSRSRSLRSFFFALFESSSLFSTMSYRGTPLSKLVRTSRAGRGSKSPARTDVAVRRRRFWAGRGRP